MFYRKEIHWLFGVVALLVHYIPMGRMMEMLCEVY